MMKRISFLVAIVSTCLACADPSEDSPADEVIVSADELATTSATEADYTRAEVDAKLFGYLFADGNFFTDDAAHPPSPSYSSASANVTRDVVFLACKNDYAVKQGGKTVSCGSPPNTGGSLTIESFRYPHGGDLDQMTSPAEVRAFLSGMLIGEGSRNGLVDDQFPGVPKGHYLRDQEVVDHLSLVERALERVGFGTAHLAAKADGACSGTSCREARIDASEGCRFAAVNGYTFVSFQRVPGAKSSGHGYVGPSACK